MAGRQSQRAGRLPGQFTRAIALALCAVAVFAPAGYSRTPALARSSSAPPLGGVNIGGVSGSSSPAMADREIAKARALHAKVVRVEVPWSVMEPRGPAQIEPHALAYADRLMADAAAGGIKVIAFVDSTPCWDSSAPAALRRRCAPGYFSKASAWPPSNLNEYAVFVAYLAQRYATSLAAIDKGLACQPSNQAMGQPRPIKPAGRSLPRNP